MGAITISDRQKAGNFDDNATAACCPDFSVASGSDAEMLEA